MISAIHLSVVLDIVTVLIKSAFEETTLSPWPDVPPALQAYLAALVVLLPQNAYENPAVEKTRPSHRFAAGPSL